MKTCMRTTALVVVCVFLASAQSGGPPAGSPNGVPFGLDGVQQRLDQMEATLDQVVTTLGQVTAGLASLSAKDGRTIINQERALAGGITPGDAPGFPVTLDEGGSYVFTSDLEVPDVNTSAIILRTGDPVSINLNGFSIRGSNRCGIGENGCTNPGSGNGIVTDFGSNTNGSVVFGGTVTGMGRSGVGLVGFGNTVRNMTVRNCQFGINATGLILDNVVNRNGNSGISSFNAVVKGNNASENFGVGILLFRGTASDNTADNNESFGFQSFNFSSNGTPVPGAGYYGNFFARNNNGGPQVQEGTQLGLNVCELTVCP